MNPLNYTQIRPPSARFDIAARGFKLNWMKIAKDNAVRVAAALALILGVGCESDSQGETVPLRRIEAPVATVDSRPLLVASGDPAPGKLDKPAQASQANATTARSDFAVPAASSVEPASTNSTPEITEEIPPARPANINISPATEKIIKLAESNLDEQVILTFVQQTQGRFDLDADEILYLNDVGVPSSVVAAMLKHDGDDPNKAQKLTSAPETENAQPAIPANPNIPGAITQAPPPQQIISQPLPGQQVVVTTNYVPNQQVIVQQQPPMEVQQPEQVVVANPQPEVVSQFYDSLSPYGSWMYVTDYGWCWQPTVATIDTGWRPYGPRGHWLWTENGWYWQSDYTWGWAPFHYGRWFMAGHRGWVWAPDRVWGPAWVSWRSSGDYCGWAPLPPAAHFSPGIGFSYFGRGVDVSFGFGLGYDAFCFVPVNRFHYREPWRYHAPHHEVARIFPHSRPENRYEYRHDRREFVNAGVSGVAHGAAAAVVHQTVADSRGGVRERVEQRGNQTVVYAPHAPAPGTGARVASRPSNFSGVANTAASPQSANPRRSYTAPAPAQEATRGQAQTANPPQVHNQPAATPSRANTAGQPQTVNPGRRSYSANETATSGTAVSRSVPTPQPATRAPQAAGSPPTASVVTRPSTPSPVVTQNNTASTPQVLNPATRRPFGTPSTPSPSTPAPVFRAPTAESSARAQAPAVVSETPRGRQPSDFVRPSTPAPSYTPPVARSYPSAPIYTRQSPAPTAPSYSPPVSRPPVVSTPAPSGAVGDGARHAGPPSNNAYERRGR